MRLFLLWLLVIGASAAESVAVPDWVLVGILAKETQSSYLTAPGTPITYVDQRVGKDGERGPFQMTLDAFQQIAKHGESFTRLSRDTRYAEGKAKQYLLWLYENGARGDWSVAAAMYNVGPKGWHSTHARALAYLRAVRLLGGG